MHGKLQQVVRIYGIRNCDSMKKAFVWLAEHAVACDSLFDYRQAAPTAAQLADWNHRVGWKALLNTRGNDGGGSARKTVPTSTKPGR